MTRLTAYLSQRAPIFGIAACIGVLSTWGNNPTPSRDPAGVTAALTQGTSLLAGDFFWEPSRGWIADFFLGRPLLFEARDPETPGGDRDIYRTLARVSYDGSVLDVGPPRNLTATKSADEFGLRGQGAVAFFATRGNASPLTLSFLNLEGEPTRDDLSWSQRARLGITRYLESGTWRGLGRSDLFLEGAKGASSLKVELQRGKLLLRVDDFQADFDTQLLFSDEEAAPLTDAPLSLLVRKREPSNFWHFAADTGRQIFGSDSVAWLEGRAFSFWDKVHQATYSVGGDESPSPEQLSTLLTPATQPGGDGPSAADETSWPPAPLHVASTAAKGDGKWRAVKRKVLPQGSPPLFYRTLLHPDKERPYAELHLVAMDMRRLQLGIGAGYEEPHPDTGPPGSGALPLDGEDAARVVATFNGAFKAIHGRYGMKAEGRVLVEPVVGAATVRIDHFGHAGFGNWAEGMLTSESAAFRQNLDPLVADSKFNPSGRSVWGEHLYGTGVAVERSALCLHESGQLLYGWATEATGASLAHGMMAAGCVYAIHLDMNPGHCAFLFNRVVPENPSKTEGETLDPRMQVNPTRFIRWSPKDFFYLMMREITPKVGDVQWQIAPGTRPEPSSVPGILYGATSVGGLSISLDRVNAGRLSFSVLPGSSESSSKQKGEQTHKDRLSKVLIAWGLGHRTRGNRTGLSDGTQVLSPLLRRYASLVLDAEGAKLLAPGTPISEKAETQVVQFPVLARDGALVAAANALGGKRERSALCIDAEGNLIVARMIHDTPAPLAQILLEQGCDLVVEMDRGSHPPPLVLRPDRGEPPLSGHQQSLLYGKSTAMKPHTFTF